MYKVDKNNAITMVRGDTVILDLKFYDRNRIPYEPKEGDTVRFALKKRYDDFEPILLKDIPIDTMQLVLNPEDTRGLPSGEYRGRYKYDIELTTADGFVDTVIPRADFIILEEVY